MPFRSQAQRAWMYANYPDMAKRWSAETPDEHRLPARVGPDDEQSIAAELAERVLREKRENES